METSSTIFCDGCGAPASPVHIAERLERLELATRYRPIHVAVLFVALAPEPGMEDDFYRPGHSSNFADSLLTALDITGTSTGTSSSTGPDQTEVSKLGEFQRRGYYLCYLSECPVDFQTRADSDRARHSNDVISALAPALVKRIKFNYRPKHIVLLGSELQPLVEMLQRNGLGALLIPNSGPDGGKTIELPAAGDAGSLGRFRADLALAQ